MLRRRAFVDVAAHFVWRTISSLLFWLWIRTKIRPKYLSSKGQDRWIVREIFPDLRNGFFVEIGAGNGFTGSDSFVLEQEYGWRGICIEPNPFLYRQLTQEVRRRCVCLQLCIDRNAGTVPFVLSGDTSGIVAEDTDNSPSVRFDQLTKLGRDGMIRKVEAETIGKMLSDCDAPSIIHYLSLDVEGAEERVLESFPFDRYHVLAMTVERPTERIHDLLSSVGFVLTRHRWHDGFYVTNDVWRGQQVTPSFRRKEF